jgi:hypothetical protein
VISSCTAGRPFYRLHFAAKEASWNAISSELAFRTSSDPGSSAKSARITTRYNQSPQLYSFAASLFLGAGRPPLIRSCSCAQYGINPMALLYQCHGDSTRMRAGGDSLRIRPCQGGTGLYDTTCCWWPCKVHWSPNGPVQRLKGRYE